MSNIVDWRPRFRAATIHLGISISVGAAVAVLVFGVWFPWPYRTISGGQSLFMVLMLADLVLGPTLTFVVFDKRKPISQLARDLAVIALIQVSGLVYGLHVVFLARPVAVVFEGNRFRVVSFADVVQEELPFALPELRTLSVIGPKILGTRNPRDGDEKFRAIQLAMQGVDIGKRPSFWQPYERSASQVLNGARSIEAMYAKYPDSRQIIEDHVARTGRKEADLRFVPIIAKQASWSGLIDAKTGELIGFVPVDGFFTAPPSPLTSRPASPPGQHQ